MLRTKKVISILILILSGAAVTVGLTNCNGGGFELAEGCFNDGGDPFFNYSWHLANCGQSVLARSGGTSGVDLNLRATWSSGILGSGVKIRISDDGLENTHEDLKDNFQTSVARSKDFVTGVVGSNYYKTTAPPSDTTDNHGTSVAGLIAAVAGNGIGSRGVAPKASLAIANFLTATKVGGVSVQTDSNLVQQATGTDFDILNMSWGTDQTVISAPVTAYETQLKAAITSYRSNKGAILIKSAGNAFYTSCYDGDSDPTNDTTCIGNSNFDGDNTNPYQIMVAALNAKGVAATYSSPGANIWISGFGGQFGTSSPAMFTTDRSGCTLGWSKSNAGSSVAFDNGAAPNTNCNYTVTFNGTSSAAPTVSGAVALMLEANPNLTWRDVKYILAKTAVPMDYVTTGKIPHPLTSYGVTVPTGYSWELPWQTNSAGFKFHNWYGFGKVDVDAAVALAKSYTSQLEAYKETAWFDSGTLNPLMPIGDGSLGGAASSQILVASGSMDDIKIESVQVKFNITHPDISQLAVELTSNDGMRSIVINMHNSLKNVANYTGEVFLTNAFYQMRSGQTWSIKVIDGSADGKWGTLNSWSIKFIGGKNPP